MAAELRNILNCSEAIKEGTLVPSPVQNCAKSLNLLWSSKVGEQHTCISQKTVK